MKWISPFLKKMGIASLEIYLIQGIFFTYVLNGATSDFSDWHDTLSILMIIVSILLGIVTHWLIDKSGILKLL
jgi:peptidoglycan/LPS O-acetylase OafA/YrhL